MRPIYRSMSTISLLMKSWSVKADTLPAGNKFGAG